MIFKQETITSTVIYVFIKYSIVLLGFARTTVTANILSVDEMGYLVLILLILEYAVLVLPIGSFNSINKQISNLKADIPLLSYLSDHSKKIYSSMFFIVLSSSILFGFIFILSSNIFDQLFSEVILNNRLLILIILFLSLYRVLGNMHNRVWNKFNTLSISEFVYAIIYLFGTVLFLGGDNKIQDILLIIIFANIVSIIFAKYFPTMSFFINLSKEAVVKTSSIGFFLMLYIFMESFFWGIDRIFVAMLLSPSDLANFHIAHTFSKGVMTFYLAISALIYPKLITLFTKENRNKDHLDKNMIYIIKFTETFLILAVVISTILIPLIIKSIMPAYSNLGGLFFIVSIGLLLKGLFFYPSTYFIAVDKQKWLMLISVGFLLLLCLCYFITTPLFEFTPISFTSIAVSVFLCFLVLISFYYFQKNENYQKNITIFFKLLLLYYKIIIICSCSVVFLNSDNIINQISNLSLILILIIVLYFTDFIKYSRDLIYIGLEYLNNFFNK